MMKRLLVLLTLCALVCSAAHADTAKKVRDLALTPGLSSLGFTFTAEGHERVTVKYRTSQEKGEIAAVGENGAFSGVIDLPATYAGGTVIVSLHSATGRELCKDTQSHTDIAWWQAPEKAENGRLSGVTICIDPGHQKDYFKATEDKGPGIKGRAVLTNGMACGEKTRRLEHWVVLEIGLQLRDALLLEGANVVMTRERPDAQLTNRGRADIANEAGADIFYRLHCNSRSSKTATGIVVYCPLNSDYARAVAEPKEYRQYAEALLAAMLAETGAKKGNVKLNDQFVGNNWAKMPCFLVEMGYMSTPAEDVLLSTPEYQQKLVRGMVEGAYQVALLRGVIK